MKTKSKALVAVQEQPHDEKLNDVAPAKPLVTGC